MGFTWKPQEQVEEGNSINFRGKLLCLVERGWRIARAQIELHFSDYCVAQARDDGTWI